MWKAYLGVLKAGTLLAPEQALPVSMRWFSAASPRQRDSIYPPAPQWRRIGTRRHCVMWAWRPSARSSLSSWPAAQAVPMHSWQVSQGLTCGRTRYFFARWCRTLQQTPLVLQPLRHHNASHRLSRRSAQRLLLHLRRGLLTTGVGRDVCLASSLASFQGTLRGRRQDGRRHHPSWSESRSPWRSLLSVLSDEQRFHGRLAAKSSVYLRGTGHIRDGGAPGGDIVRSWLLVGCSLRQVGYRCSD
mmetsp:Transcript_30759/g.77738  ORF Transcript_30759/g.77738 Transcript_30759/m.77738 type:complete len:244 (+) Transcript_30759:364-1095(+)